MFHENELTIIFNRTIVDPEEKVQTFPGYLTHLPEVIFVRTTIETVKILEKTKKITETCLKSSFEKGRSLYKL